MMHVHTIRASKPWDTGSFAAEQPQRDSAPAREATYHCAGHRGRPCPHGTFTVTFAAGAEPPAALDCRCGGTGRLDGAPGNAEVDLPAYGHPLNGGWAKGTRPKEGMDPMGQLRKRRKIPELEAILAERLAQVRRTGVAR